MCWFLSGAIFHLDAINALQMIPSSLWLCHSVSHVSAGNTASANQMSSTESQDSTNISAKRLNIRTALLHLGHPRFPHWSHLFCIQWRKMQHTEKKMIFTLDGGLARRTCVYIKHMCPMHYKWLILLFSKDKSGLRRGLRTKAVLI